MLNLKNITHRIIVDKTQKQTTKIIAECSIEEDIYKEIELNKSDLIGGILGL